MADQRCQMCGKSSPADAVECQYCGARLKPLIASSPSSSSEDSGSNWADASQEDALGWLRSLGQDEEEPLDSGLADDLPDWLGGSKSASNSPTSDWMNEMGGDELSDAGSPTDESMWEAPGTESQLDQWLPKGDSSYSNDQVDDFDDFSSGSGSDDLPSWLSDEKEERPEKTVPLPTPSTYSSPQEDDWLNSIENEDSLTATIADWKQPSTSSKDQMEDLPSWLTSPPSDESSMETSGFDDELPAWLTSGATGSKPTGSKSDYPSDAELGDEFPDWLDTMNSKTGMTGKLGDMPQWMDEKSSTDDDSGDASLDWLATLGDTPEEFPETSAWEPPGGGGSSRGGGAIGGLTFDPEDSFISDFNNSESPDWLQTLKEPDAGYQEASPEFPGFQASWGFNQPANQESWREPDQIEQEAMPESVEDSGIASGLPSWVKAFRPMEGADIASEFTEGELERVGPLAGLRGLLTSEADVIRTAKPPTYSDVLQVSASQQTNTQLLQSLVEAENIPQVSGEPSVLSSQSILRVIFGVILILVMLVPLVSGTEIIPLPQGPLPTELQSIENLSSSVPLDRPILVVFDYEPGLSGELEVATKVLFDHWMDRGIPLALVSTSPIGTGLGERQVAYLQNRFPYDHQYVYGENYVNLGYIAGGTAGLANFALIPRQSVKMAFDSLPIWQVLDDRANPWLSPVMRPITSIADFPMTIVITDNPETARNWIEQVEPFLRQSSLVMVVSAQAEPFVRPYFQNPDPGQRQVEGLLVGLRGGAWYEQDQGQHGLARLYWDAFGVGLLVAVVLILMGGGYNYLDGLNQARRQARRGKTRK